MPKEIHKDEIGDLVRRVAFHPSNQCPDVFLVLDIIGDYPDRSDKAHEMTLTLWEVTGRYGEHWSGPMNRYEIT